ncbi:hypothetical protein GCM10009642_61110 [Nocardiopsis metallicus]
MSINHEGIVVPRPPEANGFSALNPVLWRGHANGRHHRNVVVPPTHMVVGSHAIWYVTRLVSMSVAPSGSGGAFASAMRTRSQMSLL